MAYVCSFVSGMPSGRTNNFLESGRGLGHVTPTIFGSTVGYPSDSLASCRYSAIRLLCRKCAIKLGVSVSVNALRHPAHIKGSSLIQLNDVLHKPTFYLLI